MKTLLFFALGLPCFASTSIVSIDTTQMQAKISVHTDQAGNCAYRASRGASFSSNLPDLLDNGDTDARIGSLADGESHVFVLGTRKGSDALASAATYWIGVTCGVDDEVSRVFTTRPIPWGNLAPDPVPFNPVRFGNMDYPVIDWNRLDKSYVDPMEGVEFWRLTGPGLLGAGYFPSQYYATAGLPIDVAGSNQWTNPANAITNGKSYATAAGGPSDKLFVPLTPTIFYGAGGWHPAKTNADDVLANIYCGNATQDGITLTLQLSFDGGQSTAGRPVTTAACPQGTPSKLGTYPQSAPLPLFRGWGANPPQRNLIIPPAGTVSVASSVVTLQTSTWSGNYFPTEWVAGTPIFINGSYYHIASVQSPTQLTLIEDPGTLTNVPYSGANAGIVIFKNGDGNVDVSVGLDVYGSNVPYSGTNGASGMVNPIPVSVARGKDGRALLDPPLTGYFVSIVGQGGQGAILLWIPYNADQSIRNEIRLLSVGLKPSSSPRLHSGGDTFQYNASAMVVDGSAFDGKDGKSWFGVGSDTIHVFRMTYDETLPGCAGFPAYNPFPASSGYDNGVAPSDDCFQWYNLTPAKSVPPMDLLSQMKRAYQSGQNALGESVGAAHPNFDLGWLPTLSPGLTGGGYFTFSLLNGGEHLSIYAAFDTQTGILKLIKNLWGGDGDTEARWGGTHAVNLSAGPWRWATMNPLDNNTASPASVVFGGSFDMPIIAVSRAGAGGAPAWDVNTAISGGESYRCPGALPSRYSALIGSQNCLEVKVSSPPCNATPNSTYRFPDGKTEKDEFPCRTPGFDVADGNRSKLMDMQVGDWVYPRGSPRGERFVILSIAYNGTNDIDLWLLRWAGHNYIFPLLGVGDDYIPVYEAQPRGWQLSMAPSFSPGGAAAMAIDLSAPKGIWIPDNPQRAACHGVIGPGTAPGLYIYAEPCDPPVYRGNFNVPIPATLFQPFKPMAATFPGFAGSQNGVSGAQSYPNNSWSAGQANPPFQLDFRHLNPSYGDGPEFLNSALGTSRALTPVSGTNHSYLISDSVSGGPSDYKRLPLHGFAGHYLLKDVSGPATGNTSDLPDYSVCRALQDNECFAGSVKGDLFVTVPQAYVDNFCRSNQFTLPVPCSFQLSPFAGQVLQYRTDRADSVGLTVRKLGYAHGMPGLQYQFSNCRATPDAAFAFCLADWLDGVRSEWIALRLNPLPEPDSSNRTTFVPVTLTYQGSPDASYIRARFGYLENGGSLLRCTPYQVDCSTEKPAGAASDPYSFTNESATRQPCKSGASCTITIPAISNRMLYYVVDRLDSDGATVTSYPLQVVPVP